MYGSDILFWLFIGASIGWNLPQPIWAVYVQSKIVTFWNNLKYRIKAYYLNLFS